MIIRISGQERTACRDIFNQLFALRYEVFVKDQQWSLPVRGNLEIDQYDSPDAEYFYGIDASGEIVSHVRLNSTLTGSLLADCFSHMVEPPHSIRGPKILEGTRLIVMPRKKSREISRAAKSELLVAMFEFATEIDATDVQVMVDTRMLSSYLEMTPEVRPIGLSHSYGGGYAAPGGGEAIAIRCPVSRKVIDDIRAYGGLKNGVGHHRLPAARDQAA